MKTSKLFVYGQLKPGSKYEVESYTRPQRAKIDASMFQIKGDAGVKSLGKSKSHADGFIVTVPTSRLPAFDKMESPQFKREKTKTEKGEEVWVYAYKDKITKKDKLIKDFRVNK